MFKYLSNIIGNLWHWRARRRARFQALVDERAQRLFTKMLIKYEEDEDSARLEDLEDRKKLADAWMPFKTKRLTKGMAKALTYFDEIQLEALDTIEEEVRAELSNRAMRADGIQRDKAMWAAVGARMFLDTVKQKIEHFGGRQEREKAKAKEEAKKSEKTVVRSMSDLYEGRLIEA